jgi:hypothetical protein
VAHASYTLVAPQRPVPASGAVLASLITDMYRELLIGERFMLLSAGGGELGGAPGYWLLHFPREPGRYGTHLEGPVRAPGTQVSGWLSRTDVLALGQGQNVTARPDAAVCYDGDSVDGLLGALASSTATGDLVVIANPGRALYRQGADGVRHDQVLSAIAIIALARPLTIGSPGPGGGNPWQPYVTIDANGNVIEPAGAVYDDLGNYEMVLQGTLPDGYTWSHQVQTAVAYWADGGGLPWGQHQAPFADVLRRHLGPGLLETGEFY